MSADQSAAMGPAPPPTQGAEDWKFLSDSDDDDQIHEHVNSQTVNEKRFDVGGIPAADPDYYDEVPVQSEESLDPGITAGSMEEMDQQHDETQEEYVKRVKAFRVYESLYNHLTLVGARLWKVRIWSIRICLMTGRINGLHPYVRTFVSWIIKS
jgi:hypothetical protein